MFLSPLFAGIAAILVTFFLSFVAVQAIYANDQTPHRYYLDQTATRLDAAWIGLRRRWQRGDRLLAVLLAFFCLYSLYSAHKRVTFPGTLDLRTVQSVVLLTIAAIGTDIWDAVLALIDLFAHFFIG